MGIAESMLAILHTLLRMVPWPCRPGLRIIGRPDRQAPVLVTGNDALTVARVRRALRGTDAYLLVVNSHGINVWCAASGGHLSHHQVITALKASDLAQRVDHRQLILPPLAATGILASEVERHSGWQVIWGPTAAKDLPAFLRGETSPTMHQVRFPLAQRLEMAIAWAFPVSLIAAALLWWLWPSVLWAEVVYIWAMSLALYVAFPLYAPWIERHQVQGSARPLYLLPLLAWSVSLGGSGLYGILFGSIAPGQEAGWALLSLITTWVLCSDLPGTTPVLRSALSGERAYHVELTPERCLGEGTCVQVCPRGCFRLEGSPSRARQQNTARCLACGACIVQCPGDALAFVTPEGERIAPEITRRYRVNMMGKRRLPI